MPTEPGLHPGSPGCVPMTGPIGTASITETTPGGHSAKPCETGTPTPASAIAAATEMSTSSLVPTLYGCARTLARGEAEHVLPLLDCAAVRTKTPREAAVKRPAMRRETAVVSCTAGVRVCRCSLALGPRLSCAHAHESTPPIACRMARVPQRLRPRRVWWASGHTQPHIPCSRGAKQHVPSSRSRRGQRLPHHVHAESFLEAIARREDDLKAPSKSAQGNRSKR